MGAPARDNEHPLRVIAVEVAGQELRLRTDQEEAAALAAAELVNAEFEQARQGRVSRSASEALALAALNLAGRLLESRREQDARTAQAEDRLKSILEKLDKNG